MKINLTKKEYINKLAVHALYYWFIGDKFNARNAIAGAAYLAKELENETPKAKILTIDFPAKRAASA